MNTYFVSMKTAKKITKGTTKKGSQKLAVKEGVTFEDLLRITVSPPTQKTKKTA